MRHRFSAPLFSLLLSGAIAGAGERTLEFAPAPADNPLKGLVPYAGEWRESFPHSMEFSYVALSELVTGERTYRWDRIESVLGEIAKRGHQAILRIYVEYPKKPSALPAYLVDAGVRVHADTGTPDYEDPRLRACLRDFIAAFGTKYDGDPRLGFLTAGLLGKWGEWHTWPESDRWASRQVQGEVLDAYEAAFKITPVLLRYPVGDAHPSDSPNAGRAFGYHDDSFAWGTLATGSKDDFWFYIPALRAAGAEALRKWETHPIGGEIRPEAWGQVFDAKPENPRVQDFATCVRETHVSWLMDSGMFGRKDGTKERRARAETAVRAMGYTFHVPAVRWSREGEKLAVSLRIENRGVAPFYLPWPIEWALLDDDGGIVRSLHSEANLSGILPGDHDATRSAEIDLSGLPPSRYQLAMRVPNPLPGGSPVRFANATQDEHAPGWLTLSTLAIP